MDKILQSSPYKPSNHSMIEHKKYSEKKSHGSPDFKNENIRYSQGTPDNQQSPSHHVLYSSAQQTPGNLQLSLTKMEPLIDDEKETRPNHHKASTPFEYTPLQVSKPEANHEKKENDSKETTIDSGTAGQTQQMSYWDSFLSLIVSSCCTTRESMGPDEGRTTLNL